MDTLSVIIVSFGRSKLLEDTLKSLFETKPDKVGVIVIDNGSGKETINVLRSYKYLIDKLVLFRENKGKPHAWNLGADIVNKLFEPRYYLFCDSDLLFKYNWYEKMINTYKTFEKIDTIKIGALSGYI